MNETVTSVEDIDAMLDKEFGDMSIQEPTQEMDVEEPTEVEEPVEEPTNDDSSNDEPKFEETQEIVEQPKETKEEHAFAKLRSENSQLKTELDNAKSGADFLKELATQFGYEDENKFMEEYRDARVKQEAQEKGYDPVLYSQLQEANKRIAQLEKVNKDTQLEQSAKAFRTTMDSIIKEYDLGEDYRDNIFNSLEKAGYDIETLLSSPSPEIIIKGVLSDKIAEISKQSQINKMDKLDALSDEMHNNQQKEKVLSVDEIIAEEMKQYAADNFY